MAQATYSVTGMTCQNCVSHVTEELTALPGVTAVDVFLVPDGASSVQVTSDSDLDRDTVEAAIDEAGYDLV